MSESTDIIRLALLGDGPALMEAVEAILYSKAAAIVEAAGGHDRSAELGNRESNEYDADDKTNKTLLQPRQQELLRKLLDQLDNHGE